MIPSLQNHFKSRQQDSLLYLDQSALQIINVIRRYRQRPRRVLLLRAIEGLAVVTSNHPDYLVLARLGFKLHKRPYPCLTHPGHFLILLRVLSIFFGGIVSGLLYEAVYFFADCTLSSVINGVISRSVGCPLWLPPLLCSASSRIGFGADISYSPRCFQKTDSTCCLLRAFS